VLLLLMFALPAWAESVAVFDGAMQNGWTASAFSIVDAPGQAAGTQALCRIGLTDWKAIGGTSPILGNTFLEFDVYFDTTKGNTSTSFGVINESWDTDYPKYEMSNKPSTPVWYRDGVQMSPLAYSFAFSANTWQHFKLDLNTSTNGQPIPGDGNFGIIFGNWTGAADMYLMNVAFTPEPATIALMSMGGLALIRKKR
jgi:hypothetical protein